MGEDFLKDINPRDLNIFIDLLLELAKLSLYKVCFGSYFSSFISIASPTSVSKF